MRKKLIFIGMLFFVGTLCACRNNIDKSTTNSISDITTSENIEINPTTTTPTTKPTTTTEEGNINFTGYYASLQNVKQVKLKAELKNLLVRTKKTLSYDTIWDTCEEGNEDPNNSNNVILFYSGLSVKKNDHVSGAFGWNREHVYPQSYPSCNKTDAHHLMPDDNKSNSIRGNDPFNEIPNGNYVKTSYGKMTTSKTGGGYFEPRDEVKGDVARIIMYKEIVYNISITRIIKNIDLLLKWHRQDPVDDFEKNRNDVIFSFQKNRNPFIDYPELADLFY